MFAASLALGCEKDASTVEILAPQRIGSAEVPLSRAGSIALLSDEATACVIDSYEVQVRCVDRNGTVIGAFGREGEGPGEFGSLSQLVGGPDGSVGTVDNGLDRFSVFGPSGILTTEVELPGAAITMNPVWRFSETLAGVSITTFDPDVIAAGAGPGGLSTLFEIDIASGAVVREEEVPPVEAEVECGRVIYGLPNPAGGWVFIACEGHLIFVGDGAETTLIQAPTYTGELPTDRDVAAWTEVRTGMQRIGIGLDQEALDRYRTEPKNYHLVLGQQKFDDQGRFWIATQRDRDDFSYLDVYLPSDAAFLGSVRVHDRIEGFDLVGSTLVVVVERQLAPDDPDGIPSRAVGWYDVGEWQQGGESPL